ncbi:MAG: helix-turn-helix transcriptional regulator [Ignavibacteriae bacterium]|nr:helix-turn-helix transcriptional regulator [Bacteroidota bacterium]MCB0752545.1 helix-turn-helix transcriptional regulator [Ignavibacteriota bacterium]
MLSEIDIYVINKVKEIRISKNFSQAELAHMIGVSSGFIGKVESLKYNSKYNLKLINKISKAFDISPKELLPKKHL